MAVANTHQYTIGAADTRIDMVADFGVTRNGLNSSFYVLNLSGANSVTIMPSDTALAATTDAGGYTIPPGKMRQFAPTTAMHAFASGAGTIIEISGDQGGAAGPIMS